MMRRRTPCSMILATLLMLAGCATLRPDFEAPTVTVSSIRALPAETMVPRFEIGLHIVNPNRAALELHGLAYRLTLQGYNILTGVAKDLPTIDGYGEGNLTLIATADMVNSIRWLANLISTESEIITYELEAKLDLGGVHPLIRVKKKGEINLSAEPR